MELNYLRCQYYFHNKSLIWFLVVHANGLKKFLGDHQQDVRPHLRLDVQYSPEHSPTIPYVVVGLQPSAQILRNLGYYDDGFTDMIMPPIAGPGPGQEQANNKVRKIRGFKRTDCSGRWRELVVVCGQE